MNKHSLSHVIIAASTAAVLSVSTPLFAETNKQTFQAFNTINDVNVEIINALKAVKAKNYAQACSVLNSMYDAPVLSLENSQSRQAKLNVQYLLGQCYAGLGLYKQAQPHFEAVIAQEANQPRPHLDLALTYQYIGEYDKARQQFDAVMAMNNVDDKLRSRVQELSDASPDALQYYVNFVGGAVSDTNINNAPIVDSIIIYDEEFIFNRESRPLESTGLSAGIDASVSKLLSADSYITGNVSFASTGFSDYSRYDNTVIDISGSYNQKFWIGEYSIQPRFASISIGSEGFLDVIGVDAGFTALLDDSFRVNSKLGYQQYGYSDDSERDLSLIKPEFSLNYRYNSDWLIHSSVAFGLGSASNDIYSFTDLELKIGTDYALMDELLLSFSYRLNSTSYDGEIEGFKETRSDTRSTITVGASYNLKNLSDLMKRVTIDFGANIYQNDSNIPLFENERTQIYLLFNVAL